MFNHDWNLDSTRLSQIKKLTEEEQSYIGGLEQHLQFLKSKYGQIADPLLWQQRDSLAVILIHLERIEQFRMEAARRRERNKDCAES